MSVICFASLKGGVGKTSLSINVSHAFSKRGCETLIIDCDPIAHTTRLFEKQVNKHIEEAPIAKLFLSKEFLQIRKKVGSLAEAAEILKIPLVVPVRDKLSLLPGGEELRYFLSMQGARYYRKLFPKLISELREAFDQIIIDTPPDFNVITRNAFADADLVAVPVDPSEMSIYCLEELLRNCVHITKPNWAIIQTMVNRQASRVNLLASKRLGKNFDEEESEASFLTMLKKHEELKVSSEERQARPAVDIDNEKPIYLLHSKIYRTEMQNKLSFLKKTALDSKGTSKLAEQYWSVARELEEVLELAGKEEETESVNEYFGKVTPLRTSPA